jgi:hypothetical protein
MTMNILDNKGAVQPPGSPVRFRRTRFFGLVVFLLPIVLPLHAQDMSERDLQNMYMSYLRGQGYSPTVDEDGDVAFGSDDLTFYIIVNADDPEYFNLMFPTIYSVDTQQERQRAADAISEVNRKRKVAKLYMNSQETRISAGAEVFLRTPGDFEGTFTRMLSNVLLAAKDFLEIMED